MDDQRYHVTLAIGGQLVMHGWWSLRMVAEGKCKHWIGEHGGGPGARITLVDEGTGSVLTNWPEES